LREWPAEGNESKPESRKWERPEDFLDIFFSECRENEGLEIEWLERGENNRGKRDEQGNGSERHGGRTGARQDDISTASDPPRGRWIPSRSDDRRRSEALGDPEKPGGKGRERGVRPSGRHAPRQSPCKCE